MRLTGDDVDQALREMITNQIKGAPARQYDLGKFFFSVSTLFRRHKKTRSTMATSNRQPAALVRLLALLALAVSRSWSFNVV